MYQNPIPIPATATPTMQRVTEGSAGMKGRGPSITKEVAIFAGGETNICFTYRICPLAHFHHQVAKHGQDGLVHLDVVGDL